MEFEYQLGDEVAIQLDDSEDWYQGTVVGYDFDIKHWIIQVVDEKSKSFEYRRSADEIAELDQGEDDEIPRFGMGIEEFRHHAEYLMTKALERVADVGPEQAFFGFQEFEGKEPAEILADLMIKTEEGMALLAQAHILIGRIIVALTQVGQA